MDNTPDETGRVNATGKVIFTHGNLIQVEFEGAISQGEIAFVQLENEKLKAEVIAIRGKVAKCQVFEDTVGVKFGDKVNFINELLSVELGPGLLSAVFDGLQVPLEKVADACGLFLQRGVYIEALDRVRLWDFKATSAVGDTLKRGDEIGTVPEASFTHRIMLPFSMFGSYKLTWVIEAGSYTVDEVVARVADEKGVEIELTMVQNWPVKIPLIEGTRALAEEMLVTGMRILDTMIPMAMGGTHASPGPFGAGKTVTQHHISKYSNVDVVIITACGERAGEVVEVLKEFPKLQDVHSDRPLMDRTVIICNTSSMPVAAREASVYTGITIAEYYRQMGLNVLMLADSTSRWAQALREMSGRLEEIPGEEAFPAYLSSRIASFYERAGVIQLVNGDIGSVSILGAVSPPGGNFYEPVTQSTLAIVGSFINLSREHSDRRIYPAIDGLKSWSKYGGTAVKTLSKEVPEWSEWVSKARMIMETGDEIARRMEVLGEEGTSIEDLTIHLKSELFSFCYLQQNAFEVEDAYCPLEQQIVQFRLMNRIFNMTFPFKNPDELKSYFLKLQGEIKNINYLKFQSEQYRAAFTQIEKGLEQLASQEESVV